MPVVRTDVEINVKGEEKISQTSGTLRALGKEGVAAGAAIGAGFAVAEKAMEIALGILKSIPAEISRVISTASGLADLAAKTQMTTDSLQRMKYAGSLVGVTLEDISAASLKVQRNLVENPKAFDKWGLSAKALRDLRPEEQLAAIADVIRKIPEPARQVAAAMDLMGKGGAANMALLRSDLQQVLAEADDLGVTMGDELVGHLDDVDDATTRLEASWTALKDKLVGGVVAASGADQIMNDLAQAIGAINLKAKDGISPLGLWVQIVERFAGISQLKDMISLLSLSNVGSPAVKGKGLDTSPDQIDFDRIMRDAIKLTEEQVKADDKATAAAKRHAEALRKQGQEAKYTLDIAKEFNRVLDAEADAIQKAISAAPLHNLGPLAIPGGKKAGFFDPNDPALSQSTQKLIAAAEKGAEKWQAWGDVIATVASQLGGTFGDVVAGLGGVFDNLAARERLAAENLRLYGTEAMTTGQKIQAIASGLSAVIGAYKQAEQMASPGKGAASGAAKGAAAGAAFGPYGIVIGGVIGGIAGFLGGKKGQAKELAGLRTEFEDLMEQAKRAGVVFDHIFNPKNAKEYKAAIDEVKKALDTQAEAQEKLQDAIDRYGFTIEELGPTMARQKLDEQAMQLYQDWQLLNAAGVDHTAILERMGPALNDYVNASIAAGVEIPKAMKPIIDDLYTHGKLLHENGDAYTEEEYKGIKYAETMSEMFQELITKVTELVNALLNIPNTTSTHTIVTRRVGGNPGDDTGDNGGDTGDGGDQHDRQFASGLFMPSASSDGFLKYHRGERIEITPAANSAARNASGGGGHTFNVTVNVAGDGDAQKIRREVQRALDGGYIKVPA